MKFLNALIMANIVIVPLIWSCDETTDQMTVKDKSAGRTVQEGHR